MPERTLSVLDGSTFVVGDRSGDVRADEGREHGFFSDDTRFLSRWVLRVGDAPLQLLGLDQSEHYAARFFLAPTVSPDDAAPWSVMRRRLVDEVWIEEVRITNHRHAPTELRLALEAATDFADLFEVKDGPEIERAISVRHDDRSLVFAYEHEGFERAVEIVSSRTAAVSGHGFEYTLLLRPGEEWAVTFSVTPRAAQPGATFPPRSRRGPFEQVRAAKQAELSNWLAAAPQLRAEEPSLARTYRASLVDLGALRMHPHLHDGATLPAAGLPWFMALFGRDSLITSFQALPYLPELAATTLLALAARQSAADDDFRDQEPGKILHELRFGELTVRGARPQSPYYGTADATPLFLVLLDEYQRWSGDDALVRALEPNARAALAWIEESGDADGDGYVEYARRNRVSGLANQCWKDSWDAIQFADGRLAHGPIATCEIQGYVYDARRRAARLAREVWNDPLLAEQLERQAADLRARFHHDFWIPERGCYALALDGDKRRVDGLTSNVGHLLWSGLLDEEGAAATAAQLLEPQLWSGWGVRTLGAREGGYNPLGYHTGTVWPHDNSLIAAGLARYGHHEEAATIAGAILSAAPYFEHRLPELFGGFAAASTTVPVAFPTASRPQAWAAGAALQLLTTLLRLTPGDATAEAFLPSGLGHVALDRRAALARSASASAGGVGAAS